MKKKGSAQEQSNVVFFSGYCCKPNWPSWLQRSLQLLNIVRGSNFIRCNNRCSGNQRQKPSRYLPDIWTKRGPRDIWAKAVREGVDKKKRFLCCANLHQQSLSRAGNGSFQLRSVNTKALSAQFWQRGSFIPCSDQIELEVEKSQAPKVVSSIRSNWNLSSVPLSSLLICASDKKSYRKVEQSL